MLNRISFVWLILILTACGGGGGGSSSSGSSDNQQVFVSTNLAANAISFNVGNGPGNNINIPYVSVTVCQPNSTTQCQTIDNVLLDTGSIGLRIISSALGSLVLNNETIASSPILECATFLGGVTWGPVKLADVRMSSELASSLPIQVIADPSYLSVPVQCSNGMQAMQTPGILKANGILGIGLFVNDRQNYFNCVPNIGTSCALTLPPSMQVQNPVASFATDNNGVIVRLQNIDPSGAANATGALYFGIDTQVNNASAGARMITANANGKFTTTVNGSVYTNSFIDSGSNALFFPAGNQSAVLTACPVSTGFYCPAVTQSYTASVVLQNSTLGSIAYSVANLDNLAANGNYAFNNIAGPVSNIFDWGLPFFYGKSVYFGITGKTSNAGTGPLYGYSN